MCTMEYMQYTVMSLRTQGWISIHSKPLEKSEREDMHARGGVMYENGQYR